MTLSQEAENYILSPQTPVDAITSPIIQELLQKWVTDTKLEGSKQHRLVIVGVVIHHFLPNPQTASMRTWKKELQRWEAAGQKGIKSKDPADLKLSANWEKAEQKKKNRWVQTFEPMPLIWKVMHSHAVFDMERELTTAVHEEALYQKPGYREAIERDGEKARLSVVGDNLGYERRTTAQHFEKAKLPVVGDGTQPSSAPPARDIDVVAAELTVLLTSSPETDSNRYGAKLKDTLRCFTEERERQALQNPRWVRTTLLGDLLWLFRHYVLGI